MVRPKSVTTPRPSMSKYFPKKFGPFRSLASRTRFFPFFSSAASQRGSKLGHMTTPHPLSCVYTTGLRCSCIRCGMRVLACAHRRCSLCSPLQDMASIEVLLSRPAEGQNGLPLVTSCDLLRLYTLHCAHEGESILRVLLCARGGGENGLK